MPVNSTNDAGPHQILVGRGCSFSAPSPYKVFEHQHLNSFWRADTSWGVADRRLSNWRCSKPAPPVSVLDSAYFTTLPKSVCIITSLCTSVPREMFSCSLRLRSFLNQLPPTVPEMEKILRYACASPRLEVCFPFHVLVQITKEHKVGDRIHHFRATFRRMRKDSSTDPMSLYILWKERCWACKHNADSSIIAGTSTYRQSARSSFIKAVIHHDWREALSSVQFMLVIWGDESLHIYTCTQKVWK